MENGTIDVDTFSKECGFILGMIGPCEEGITILQ